MYPTRSREDDQDSSSTASVRNQPCLLPRLQQSMAPDKPSTASCTPSVPWSDFPPSPQFALSDTAPAHPRLEMDDSRPRASHRSRPRKTRCSVTLNTSCNSPVLVTVATPGCCHSYPTRFDPKAPRNTLDRQTALWNVMDTTRPSCNLTATLTPMTAVHILL